MARPGPEGPSADRDGQRRARGPSRRAGAGHDRPLIRLLRSPGTTSTTGETLFAPAVRGKTTRWLGSLDQPHTLGYLDDMARALATLGERTRPTARCGISPPPSRSPGAGFSSSYSRRLAAAEDRCGAQADGPAAGASSTRCCASSTRRCISSSARSSRTRRSSRLPSARSSTPHPEAIARTVAGSSICSLELGRAPLRLLRQPRRQVGLSGPARLARVREVPRGDPGGRPRTLVDRASLIPVPRTVPERYARQYLDRARRLHEEFWRARGLTPPDLEALQAAIVDRTFSCGSGGRGGRPRAGSARRRGAGATVPRPRSATWPCSTSSSRPENVVMLLGRDVVFGLWGVVGGVGARSVSG